MWTEANDTLNADFTFSDFQTAFDFMTRVAAVAEGMNHHPTWTNTYNKVSISLSTHDAGDTITDKDWELARAIDSIVKL